MAKVSEVRVSGGTSDLGTFHVQMFNIFDPDQLGEYETLRTKHSMSSATGIKIENIREVARKTVIVDRNTDGSERTETREDVFVCVQWWEKRVERDKGDSNEEVGQAAGDWSSERKVG